MSALPADVTTSAMLFGGVIALTAGWVAIAPHLGLVDDARDAPERKTHARPVPLVGGIVLAHVIAGLAWVQGPGIVGGRVLGAIGFEPRATLVALALAFATGLLDDLLPRGLSPFQKLAGQTLAGCALAVGLETGDAEPSVWARALTWLAALAAQNAANTFDNADGALCAVATAGLLPGSPLGAATLAFLPWNLARRRGSPTPVAWLGDGGSHLVGILLLTTPGAAGALFLPLLDLARVAWLRRRAGVPVWRGDRRHLAHALQARGLGPLAVVAVLILLALPFVLGWRWLAS